MFQARPSLLQNHKHEEDAPLGPGSSHLQGPGCWHLHQAKQKNGNILIQKTLQPLLIVSKSIFISLPCPDCLILESRQSPTYTYCPAASVGAGHQTAFRCCHWNLVLFTIQAQRPCYSDRDGHISDHILTASSHHLRNTGGWHM